MPKAVADTTEITHFELKSLAEGFVDLKLMTYGQMLARQDMMMHMRMEAAKGQSNASMEVSMLNEKVAVFDFSNCVVDHNLEDADGNKLLLSSSEAVKKLHPRIGQEIGDLINKLNQFEDEVKN